jgi:putative intracellular protease/amidase
MTGAKILVLTEEHYDETEFNVFNQFFPANGVSVDYASFLWGNESLEFEGNDKTSKVKVEICVSQVNLEDYKGLILIGGYAMDRLRYQPSLSSSRNTAPAVELLRKAVQRMDAGQIAIGTICHSLWLFCADPELIKGRHVTCAHNIVCDVENAGGELVIANGETVDVHADGLLITGRHPGSVEAFDDLFLKTIQAI